MVCCVCDSVGFWSDLVLELWIELGFGCFPFLCRFVELLREEHVRMFVLEFVSGGFNGLFAGVRVR